MEQRHSFIYSGVTPINLMTKYELWLTSDIGARIAHLSTILNMTATRVVNDIGKINLRVPLSFNPNLLAPDRMVQLWRAPDGMPLSLWRVYFIRRWKFEMQGSQDVVTLFGPDSLDLMRRRVVAAYRGSSQAKKSGLADDLMKAYVTDALSDANPPIPSAGTRAWSRLSVASNVGLGPSVSRDLPYHKLLTSSGNGVLSVLSKAAKEAGTEVFFDVIPIAVSGDSITFGFVTAVNQPGLDVSDKVVFDVQRGNMLNPALEYDYSDEENYIYAAGQGEESTRKVAQVYDNTRYGNSIWNRCEGSTDAQESTIAALQSAGRTALSEGRPKIRFTATPVDTKGTRFGEHWDVGYKVRAKFKTIDFATIIRSATINLTPKGETIQTRLDYET